MIKNVITSNDHHSQLTTEKALDDVNVTTKNRSEKYRTCNGFLEMESVAVALKTDSSQVFITAGTLGWHILGDLIMSSDLLSRAKALNKCKEPWVKPGFKLLVSLR